MTLLFMVLGGLRDKLNTPIELPRSPLSHVLITPLFQRDTRRTNHQTPNHSPTPRYHPWVDSFRHEYDKSCPTNFSDIIKSFNSSIYGQLWYLSCQPNSTGEEYSNLSQKHILQIFTSWGFCFD
ncbi:hypothetical protein AFLA_009772 [Aspergillus flavus NRRL3357]|nr:hypothetical protein AFLA_009772 [Aspergillus flavus NRRL3357]